MIPVVLASTSVLDLSSVDLSGITQGILDVVPIVIPVVVTILAIKKGISFLKSMLKGA